MSDECRRHPPNVTVVIVGYNAASLVAETAVAISDHCLRAGIRAETVVIDNGSRDGTAELVRAACADAVVLEEEHNLGFGAATNLGAAHATAPYLLLLNPDASIDGPSLRLLLGFMDERPACGAVAPLVVDTGAGRAESGGMLPGVRSAAGQMLLLNRLLLGDRGGPWRGLMVRRSPGTRPRRLEWASASVLLVRRSAFESVAGFDPTIFLYGEDIDLCDRLGRRGWSIWLMPSARASHEIAGTQGGITDMWIDGLHTYLARRCGRARLVAFDAVLTAGLLARWLTAPSTGGDLQRRRMKVAARRAATLLLDAALHGPGGRESRSPARPAGDAT
jgi:N-acetylglucosaminyl-diphospho-decaprenol L-rhamnosyltransferase